MKKTFALLLVLALLLALCACGGGSTTTDGTTPNDSAANADGTGENTGNAADTLIGFCSVSMSESIYVMEEEALKEIFAGKATIQTVSCDNDAALQISQIKNFVTMGADMIIINPTDIEALGDAIMEAHNAGCKVYINGATSDSIDEEYYDCCSVSDEYLCGAYVALIAKNWIEAHEEQLNASGDWEIAFLESTLSEETVKRSIGEKSILEPYLKDWEGNYVDVSGNIVDEANKVENPAYCQLAADHYKGVSIEQDEQNGGLNVANVLTTNPNTRVFIAYNSLASTQGGQYVVDNYPDKIEEFAFFSAGVMGNEADYMVGSVSATDGVVPSVMRGACQFGVSAAGGEVADSVARTAYAIMYGEEGVDYFKKNPDGIAAWWTIDETWGGGTATVAHFNILSGATVLGFDPIGALSDENTVIYWNSKDGFIPEEKEATVIITNGEPAKVTAGVYEYIESSPYGDIRWTVTLNEDGSFEVAQPENEGMGNPVWTGDAWVDNGDGTFTTPDCQGDGPQIASFWEDGSITWQLLNDGHTTPILGDTYESDVNAYGIPTNADPVEPGTYEYIESSPYGDMLWTVTLNEDGSFEVAQPENESLGCPVWTGDAWVDNGNGTFTTPDCQGDGPQIATFWDDGSITWIDNGDGTATPVE